MTAINPLGVPQILFLIALCVFALWKTSYLRLILSVCIIIWGVFSMPYDVKIAAPMVGLGVILFFTGLFKVGDLGARVRELIGR